MNKIKAKLSGKKEIERSLTRLAHEIIEKNDDLTQIAIVGIRTRGDFLAKRLHAQIEKLYHRNWSKLEKSYKINRLKRYVKKKRKESKMSDEEYNELLEVLITAVKSKSLNSVSYIKYDVESA